MSKINRISEKELNEKLRELQNLIKFDQSMPKNISEYLQHDLFEFLMKFTTQQHNELLLIRNLKFYNGNVEKALKRLMANMELRQYYTNIYQNRDPFDSRLRRLIDQILMFLMPKVTAENNRIMILKLIELDADSIVADDALTVFSMVYDATLITREEGRLADGEILIIDLEGVTAKHLTKIGFSSLRCFFKYMNEAHPMRINQIHLINCPSVLDKLMILCRPLMYSSTMKVLHFHLPDSTTLFDFVPRELLPDEIGGTGGSLEVPKWDWIRRTEEHRDFLLNNDQWTMIENMNENNNLAAEESFAYMGFC